MVNKVILIGNVGADPDVKYLDGGVAVARFSLATSETYNNKNGERVSQTEWHNIVLWRNVAQIAEKYVKKGMTLYIEGSLRTRNYEDNKGVKHNITEIYGDNIQMLSRKQDNDNTSGKTSSSHAESTTSFNKTGYDDDLPF